MREAQYYSKQSGGITVCRLCPKQCNIAPGNTGACRARQNRGGVLYALNYGEVSSVALDPIEKKPLRRFFPGSTILSAGSFGCNFHCPFCQNYGISQEKPQTAAMPPEELVQSALSARGRGNIGIAYTYNEPLIWYEYVKETAELAHGNGLLNVLVTNGYINPAPLAALLPSIDAMNIDIKGGDAFYRELCGADRQTVLNTLQASYSAGLHIEATLLLVSGHNDNLHIVEDIARKIAGVCTDIPLHISRFFPRYKMPDMPPTDMGFMGEAVQAAKSHLAYVYAGNV